MAFDADFWFGFGRYIQSETLHPFGHTSADLALSRCSMATRTLAAFVPLI